MAIYSISDLHLSFGVNKPMDVFRGWENYTELLKENWLNTVKAEDTVVLPGDFSWGLKTEETLNDFMYLNSLPGKKILLKGNHDFWWTTLKKNEDFLKSNGIDNVSFLQNGHYEVENIAICGARGWFLEDTDNFSQKISDREVIRLRFSLESAEKAGLDEKIVFLHFPPVYKDKICDNLIELMHQFNVKECYYGHIHGGSSYDAFNGIYENISMKMVSADYLRFSPLKIR